MSIFVYGPQGCGKTTFAEALAAHFGLSKVWDEGTEGRLLASLPADLECSDTLYLGTEPPKWCLDDCISFEEAMRAAQLGRWELRLGRRMRDRVTGLEGIATARVEYLNGCVQFCIKPPVQDGKTVEAEYVDQQQLEVVDAGIDVRQRRTGGPARDVPPSAYRG